ncbi:hypothetical protein [Haladaptatus sp. NG-WS-4]
MTDTESTSIAPDERNAQADERAATTDHDGPGDHGERDGRDVRGYLSFCEERIPPFTAGVNPATPSQTTHRHYYGYLSSIGS